ncbi:phosphoribosylanthranilate isomerase [Spirosoma spitsbergense]|uniref:phosphoribosylanthranilate isomerase n=1 Tax=Spirosoma spitsbergense TaxID=431554 RepID=UPI000382E5C4|nr:hypothetical protein [Spirosoma spitsbergense]
MESPFRTRVKICCISSLEEARLAILFGADALGLDSGNPTLALKELGGTGRVHNWRESRQIVAQSQVPVFLVGGSNPENVQKALESVQPYGLDICSGVRTNGHLDAHKLEAFMQVVRNLLLRL